MRFLLLILFLLLACLSCPAQTFLAFYKNSFRNARYEVGDVITFRIKGHPNKITDQIKSFEDSLVIFQYYKVNPKEFTDMYPDKKTRNWYFLRYKWEKLLPTAGVGYILLEWLNDGKIDDHVLVTGGTLIGAGLLARLIISRSLKIKGKKKLRILHL